LERSATVIPARLSGTKINNQEEEGVKKKKKNWGEGEGMFIYIVSNCQQPNQS